MAASDKVVRASLDQLPSLVGKLPDSANCDPPWARQVKFLALPACLFGSFVLAVWALSAYDSHDPDGLPSSLWGMAALTVVFASVVGLGGGLAFYLLGRLLHRFGARPVALSVVGYCLLLGFCLGVACSVLVLNRIARTNASKKHVLINFDPPRQLREERSEWTTTKFSPTRR
jgi:hypothetical protein